jgi:hypothetical protein
VTSFHSPRTFSRPRSQNCRKPITDLMMPNTGSGICLRSAYPITYLSSYWRLRSWHRWRGDEHPPSGGRAHLRRRIDPHTLQGNFSSISGTAPRLRASIRASQPRHSGRTFGRTR